jgi:branched-chain amino acid transport system ATP-binding protein
MTLVCSGITKRYGGFTVVSGVALGVDRNEILGIAGPNGAGKTTLFDVLSGYVKAESGSVELNGRNVTSASAQRRARLGLARTFQSPLVPTSLTVGEALDAARQAWLPRPPADSVPNARQLVGLDLADDVLSGRLDTLNRRKLLLACLLVRTPSVLLLDEPCSGLLQDEIDEMDGLIRRVAAETGCGVVVVEHRLELLLAVASRVVVLDEGKVVAEGPPEEVFTYPAVRRAYFEAPRAAA